MTTRPTPPDPSAARATLAVGDRSYRYYDLEALGIPDLDRLPYTVKVLIENAARHAASGIGLVTPNDLAALANWRPDAEDATTELPFLPARVILQDFTGVPCVVDLAAMRDS
ncbi:MAG TPA: aconitate hydratase, partial [Candidatus Limnocylindria bacterium]